MEPDRQRPKDASASGVPDGYEPPAVDEVLRSEDLARESHYAGVIVSGAPG